MGTVTPSHIFVDESTVPAAQINDIYTDILAELNGGLDDNNVDSISEAKIDMDTALGHNHNDVNSRLAALAVVGGNQGSLIVNSGAINIVAGDDADVVFDKPFNQYPLIKVYWDAGILWDYTNGGEGGYYEHVSGRLSGYQIMKVTELGFRIRNMYLFDYDFKWIAIGV